MGRPVALLLLAGLALGGCFDNPFAPPDLLFVPPGVVVDLAVTTADLSCPPGQVQSVLGCCTQNYPDCCGYPACNGACTAPLDPNNCGACGNVCPPGVACGVNEGPDLRAVVQCLCPAGQSRCPVNGKLECVNSFNDSNHCGACNYVCPHGAPCGLVAGRGAPVCLCPGGLTRCGADCVDLKSDNDNCGSCGSSCRSGCSGGGCCNIMGNRCGNDCVDLTKGTTLNPFGPGTPLYCGACGLVCPPCSTCAGGVCRSNCSFATCDYGASGCVKGVPGMVCNGGTCACGPGLTSCQLTGCVALGSDPANCGACQSACPLGQVCSRSACKAKCDVGLTTCGASCVDLSTSHTNCGRCGNTCTGGTVCVNGQCACSGGLTLCNGQCVELRSDTANCGGCGRQCGDNQWCVAGVCVCRSDMTLCNGACSLLSRDPGNCGGCGKACPQGWRCVNGLCV